MTFTSLQQLKSFGSSPHTIWADIPWPIDQSDCNMLRSCNTYDVCVYVCVYQFFVYNF